MRIALTSDPELPVPPTHYGGIERIIDILARNLVARGHEVVLFARSSSTCPVTRVAWSGTDSGSVPHTIYNAALLARHVLTGRFDIVHSCSRVAYLTPILPLSVPKLMSYHREISPHTTSAAVRLSRGTLEFSAISRWMVEANPLSGRWHIVPNGVTLRVYQKQLSVAFDAPLVFLGRIEEIKGPHIAIDVARRSGYSLIIAGNVPVEHHSWFENQIMPHVDGRQIKFVGPVDDAQKNALLGSAAALLMPILWEEPFGLVMAEAMACGTPVIGLARGAVPEVVENGVTGFVVSTVDEMVSAVGRIAELSRGAARARVEQLYSEEVMTDGYIRVYEDILERQTRAGRASLHRAPREK